MEQLRALNALESYLALSKTANSPRAAADVITQATSAPNTYVFAELLRSPNIQALRQSSDHAGYLRLLEIFAWGTWGDYQRESGGDDREWARLYPLVYEYQIASWQASSYLGSYWEIVCQHRH